MGSLFDKKISAGDFNKFKTQGKMGSNFNVGKFKFNGENFNTASPADKERFRKELHKFAMGGSGRARSAHAIDKFLHNGGLKNNQQNIRKRIMNNLFPEDNEKYVSPELRDLDVPENYDIITNPGSISVERGINQEKLASIRQKIKGMTSVKQKPKSDLGFVLGHKDGEKKLPPGFALSNRK